MRQDTESGSPQPGQGDFSLAIRPAIAGSEAQPKVDLCVYVGQLMSSAPEHAHASDACLPVPGTFDMPHEVLDTGQALVLTRLQEGSAQTRLVVIVPQVQAGIVGQ